jgi:hypothetical protein
VLEGGVTVEMKPWQVALTLLGVLLFCLCVYGGGLLAVVETTK